MLAFGAFTELMKSTKPKQGSAYNGPDAGSPLRNLADVAEAQRKDYRDNYVGFEDALIAKAQGPLDLRRARSAINDQQSVLAGIGQRANDRLGLAQSADLLAANARRDAFSNAAGKSAALTGAAQSQFDQNQSLLGQMGMFGRGLASQSLDGLNTAAQMEQSRKDQYSQAMDAYNQAKAAYNSSLWTGFGSW